MRWWTLFGVVLALAACRDTIDGDKPVDQDPGVDSVTDGSDADFLDADDDGYSADDDCDDSNAAINPGVPETPYDGVDNDCDPNTPDDDLDEDGYGIATDCADEDALINPGASEICDGLDNDCNELVDDAVGDVWYADEDADGYGDPTVEVLSCDGSANLSADPTDCDDTDDDVNPGATEVCNGVDDDCEGTIDEGADDALSWFADLDGDGFGDPDVVTVACDQPVQTVLDDTDCDDTTQAVRPTATEVCNGIDDDCSGTADDGAVDATAFFTDDDGDGFGLSGTAQLACTAPAGTVGNELDCDDTDGGVNPNATEVCNGVDDDCDGSIDDGASDQAVYYADADADGVGDLAVTAIACTPPAGYVATAGDCDDTEPLAAPGLDETCDGLDNDCDGDVDEFGALGSTTYFRDLDGDGFGDFGFTVASCFQPNNYVLDSTDCDDVVPSVYPGAPELCDGLDNDCNGQIDEGTTAVATFYEDLDGDGFGDSNVSIDTCTPPADYVVSPGDCDDDNAAAFPGANEFCDGFDNNCDGTVDESSATDADTWYLDFDGDTYGAAAFVTQSCTQPSGYVADATDCDDVSVTSFPGAPELCDGLDNDCNGLVDDGATNPATWYADLDGDGFGDPVTSRATCTRPAGYVDNPDDCDDGDSSVRPGGVEVCNGRDDDCDGAIDDSAVNASTFYEDLDGDGFGTSADTAQSCTVPSGFAPTADDCDDALASVNPGATELCDGFDNDCDGTTDEADAANADTWYADGDADGFGNPNTAQAACAQPAGFVADATDCVDNNATINPAAAETCDGLDNDCNGQVDDGASGATTWFADADGDGFGDAAVSQDTCSQPAGFVLDDTDCDDTDTLVSPGEVEVCNGLDDDCSGTADDGAVDAASWWADGDGDGFGLSGTLLRACSQPAGYAPNATDCDDTLATVNPDEVEVCNGLDDDCSGTADDDAADATTWHRDFDADGFGNGGVAVLACTQPMGFVVDDTDCLDTSSAVYPGAPEVCDGLDNDCDTVVDDGATGADTWYADADGDGFGDPLTAQPSCTPPAGFVRNDGDCDDTDGADNPLADEVCDGEDDDCDGFVDVGAIDAGSFYSDGDGDGFGDPDTLVVTCTQPPGTVTDLSDCDDALDDVNPAGTEVCDGEDNDCNGTVDDDATDAGTWYRDGDADGFGDATFSQLACAQPAGFVADATDCLDQFASVYPGAPETCDGLDNDCNGLVDDGTVSTATWYADDDGDGFGDPTDTQSTCTQPAGYVLDDRDCDDADATINPSAVETCDGVDEDCSGTADDDAIDAVAWYVDGDGDGVGAGSATLSCSAPGGSVAAAGDCNDGDVTLFPGADEVCDGVDQDCDGTADEDAIDQATWYRDADGDTFGNSDFTRLACTQPTGFVADATDCLDANDTVFPGAPETCDGFDNDCDGTIDDGATDALTWYADADADGYGDTTSATASCSQPAGFVINDADCDDGQFSVNPGATEVCDGADNDCDGDIDTDAINRTAWYVDGDGDGVGDALGGQACSVPAGGAGVAGDCDDADASSFPGAPEVCDAADNDCDGIVDGPNPTDGDTYYLDFDGDGFAGAGITVVACAAPAGYLPTTDDCDDGIATVYPGAPETCDGLDNDCNGTIDDGVVDPITFFIDDDGDGFGGGTGAVVACVNPGGYVSLGGDCDDANTAINPLADEFCDTLDNNCDGRVDEPESLDALTWYSDADGDTYGNPAVSQQACEQPAAYVGDDTDCDDVSADNFPGAPERCDGVDNDCDTVVDEDDAVDAPLWYADGDGDAYGVSTDTLRQCNQPGGYAAASGDCDDTVVTVNPAAVEICDGLDNDCSGQVDGADAVDADTWYADADADGFGDLAVTTLACTQPTGFVGDDSDCADFDAAISPAGIETCNGLDDDCSGVGDDNNPGCPHPIHIYEDRPYMFVLDPLPWQDARDFCYSYGYTMLAINDATENFWSDGISDSYSQAKWWTGMNDIVTEDTFVWENGDPVNYTNWHPGEPNNMGPVGEDCMQYNRWGDGTWNDELCSFDFRFICESQSIY